MFKLYFFLPFPQHQNRRHFWEMDWKMFKVDWEKEKMGKFNLDAPHLSQSAPTLQLFFSLELCFSLVTLLQSKSCAICQLFVKRNRFHTHICQVAMTWAQRWVSNVVLSLFWFANIQNTKNCLRNWSQKLNCCRRRGRDNWGTTFKLNFTFFIISFRMPLFRFTVSFYHFLTI